MVLKLTFAGFDYVADVDGSYTAGDSLAAMQSQTASNSVALTDDYGIDAATSTVYGDYNTATTTGNTETVAHLTATIEEAEADHLSVLVRPLIDFTVDASAATRTSPDGTVYADGDWRASYKPADTTAFFNSYDSMIVAQARAAQAGGAQMLDIGTELDQLTGAQYLPQWTKIISDVRAVYGGKLTYSAISDDDLSPWQYGGGHPAAGTGNLATQVSFWSQLDYVGIDEYAAISDAANPTAQQLLDGWEKPPTDATSTAETGGLSLIQYYEQVAATVGKPLLFTEIGYNSAPDAASQPFYTSSGTYDPALQTALYKAFFQAWKDQGNTSLQGVYLWNWEPDPATVGAGAGPNWTPQGNPGAIQAVDTAYAAATACFASGTQIATASGPVVVEALRAGMEVLAAAGGRRRVMWVGRRTIDLLAHPYPACARPVRVMAGAFGGGLPRHDLRLSPEHAVFVAGVLVPVRHLVNGSTVVQERPDRVDYHHVELERHDVLLAEGLPCESYLDTGNRGSFEGETDGPRQGHACAPVVEGGPVLEEVRGRLARAARALGFQPPFNVRVEEGRIRVAVAGRDAVRLISVSGYAGADPRRLGALVTGVWLDGAAAPRDGARFGPGFYDAEGDARWTDGAGTLDVRGASVVEIEVARVMAGRAAA